MISPRFTTFLFLLEAILYFVEGTDRTYRGAFSMSYNVHPIDVDTSWVKVEHQSMVSVVLIISTVASDPPLYNSCS
jgi:hypothetical protein